MSFRLCKKDAAVDRVFADSDVDSPDRYIINWAVFTRGHFRRRNAGDSVFIRNHGNTCGAILSRAAFGPAQKEVRKTSDFAKTTGGLSVCRSVTSAVFRL